MPRSQPGEGRPVILVDFFYVCVVLPVILGFALLSAWLLGGTVTDLILRIGGDK
jgi:hypothetical protein